MNDYTLIAHKPDGQITCKCCVVKEWSGQFEEFTCLTKDEVIKEVARILKAHNTPDSWGEKRGGSWTFILVTAVDGYTVTWTDLMEYDAESYRCAADTPLEDSHPGLLAEVASIISSINSSI